MAQTAFSSLPAAQQLNAVQLYLGPYARGDAISRTLAEAAVNPDIAASIMSRHVAAGSDAGGIAAVDDAINRGDAVSQPAAVGGGGASAPGSGHTGVSQGAVQTPNADQVANNDPWPWVDAAVGAGGAAAVGGAAYAATRGRGSNDPNVQTGADPAARGEVVPEGTQAPPSANTDQRAALPPPANDPNAMPARQTLEGEVIPGGDAARVTVDPVTGAVIEGSATGTQLVPTAAPPNAGNVYALPQPPRAVEPFQHQDEVIPGVRPIVSVDPLTGEIIERELKRHAAAGSQSATRPDGPVVEQSATTAPMDTGQGFNRTVGKTLRQLF